MKLFIFIALGTCLIAGIDLHYVKNHCPYGKRHDCKIDPCKIQTECRNHPHAKCVSDNCNGCNARWYEYGREVKCDCVICKTNPCTTAKCRGFSAAKCVDDKCNCKAKFFQDGAPVPCFGECDGPIFACVRNPCDAPTDVCKGFENAATCVADFCKGCNARWFVNNFEVKCVDDCPDSEKVQCFVNPCDFATCRGFPKAECLQDQCGGCIARWFINRSKEVTAICDKTGTGKCQGYGKGKHRKHGCGKKGRGNKRRHRNKKRGRGNKRRHRNKKRGRGNKRRHRNKMRGRGNKKNGNKKKPERHYYPK